MKINNGCKGCNKYWYDSELARLHPEMAGREGQCSKCKRCLLCCGDERIEYTCAWRFLQKDFFAQIRSGDAYERYHANTKILRGHRGKYE